MRKHLGIVLIGAMVAVGAGCSDSSNGGSGGSGGSGATGGTGATGGDNGGVSDVACAAESYTEETCEDLQPTGATVTCDGSNGTDVCDANGGTGTVSIDSEEITEDTCFSAACDYLLTRETYVIDSTLSIEPGVTVRGENNSALVITTTAQIAAAGTSDDPIVFTSSRREGGRAAGDWGGVVLLGDAVLSWGNEACGGDTGTVCRANIEGLPPTEGRGLFGGDDDTHDCGYLSYARIEYAGFVFGQDNELNGLTVGGCGSDTNLSHIQIHRGLDDGAEFFGGTASIDHLLVTCTGDDCIDWDQGYRGAVRCFIGHHFNGSSDDPRGIEGDNFSDNNNVSPRSTPYVQYGTLIGDADAAVPVTNQGIVVRRGSCGTINDVTVYGFARAGYDYRDGGWAAPMSWPDQTVAAGSCFFMNNPNYPVDMDCGTDDETDCNDDNGEGTFFAENDELANETLDNQEIDPELGDVSGAIDDSDDPDYSLANANCAGGFGPGGTDWTTGWTAYPVD